MSIYKATNPKWPDPNSWVAALREKLIEKSTEYSTLSDEQLKRNKAGAALGVIIEALAELPALQDLHLRLPLKDLLIFLNDLDNGRNHPWATPVNFGGTNLATTAQKELRVWVMIVFRLLSKEGMKTTAAYRHIAHGLSKQGRTNREGGPMRWQQVQNWCSEEFTPQHRLIQEKVNKLWSAYQQAEVKKAHTHSQTTGLELVKRFSDELWRSKHFRD